MENSKNVYETDWDIFTSTILNTDLPEQIPKYINEVQIIQSLYDNNKINLCTIWLDDLKNRKCNERNIDELNKLSTQLRMEGNEMLKKGKDYNRIAAIKYTEAIYSSAENSVNLALAHANRSVPLMSMEYFTEAYLDCEIAKTNNYPNEKVTKILERQVCCINRMTADSIETPIYPSKLLNEKYSDKFGRFMVAGESIKFAESIATEKAFAFIPVYELSDRKNFRFDCQSCGKVNVFTFPCNTCRNASYCSLQCKENHESIHSLECSGYKFDLWYDIGIAHLAFRTFISGFNDIWNKLLNVKSNAINSGTDFQDIIKIAENEPNFQYGEVLKLVTNFDKMDKKDIIVYGLTAVMLTMYLKYHTSFFNNIEARLKPKDLEILVTSIIFRHLGQMVCNGHAIVELYSFYDLKSVGVWKNSQPTLGLLNEYFKSRRVFTAIYPKISVLNHSCDPNIANRFDNSNLTIFANRDIKANDELFNCYGPKHRLMCKSERRTLLRQQYCFDCECTKCSMANDNHEYIICQNKICGDSIYLKDDDTRYWYLTDSLPEIICSKCSVKQSYTWFLRLSLLFDKNCLDSYIEIFKIVNTNMIYLSEWHELKEIIYERIISQLIPVADQINLASIDTSLVKFIYENIHLKKLKYGELSGEYIHACSFLLDYIARRKMCGSPVQLDYKSNLINCITILSNQAKLCLDNYLNKYIK